MNTIKQRREITIQLANVVCSILDATNVKYALNISASQYGSCYVLLYGNSMESSLKLRIADHSSSGPSVNGHTGKSYMASQIELFYDWTGRLNLVEIDAKYNAFWVEQIENVPLKLSIQRFISELKSIDGTMIQDSTNFLVSSAEKCRRDHLEHEANLQLLREKHEAELQLLREEEARVEAEKAEVVRQEKAYKSQIKMDLFSYRKLARELSNGVAPGLPKTNKKLDLQSQLLNVYDQIADLRLPVRVNHKADYILLKKGSRKIARVYHFDTPDNISEQDWINALAAIPSVKFYHNLRRKAYNITESILLELSEEEMQESMACVAELHLKGLKQRIESGKALLDVIRVPGAIAVTFKHPFLNDPDAVALVEDEFENRKNIKSEVDCLNSVIALEKQRLALTVETLDSFTHIQGITERQQGTITHLMEELHFANKVILDIPFRPRTSDRWLELYENHQKEIIQLEDLCQRVNLSDLVIGQVS